MKVDLDPLRRGFVANVLRQRAMQAKEKAEATKSDRQRVEFESEAQTAEELAILFDHGEDVMTEAPTPITPNPRVDLDQTDAPRKKAGRLLVDAGADSGK